MYAIYGNIYHQYTPNVSIYAIYGSYGYDKHWQTVKHHVSWLLSRRIQRNWKIGPIHFNRRKMHCFGILSGMFFRIVSGILFGIVFGIPSGILSGKYIGIASGIFYGILSCIYSDMVSGISSGILSGIFLAFYLEYFWHFMSNIFWHSTCYYI